MTFILKLLTCNLHMLAFDITQLDFQSQTRGRVVSNLESRDVFLQPLLPVILGEAARDPTFNHTL